MKAYVQMMKAVWASWQDGAKPEFLGKEYRYTLMTPNFNPGPIAYPQAKICLAVVGPAMARVAGKSCRRFRPSATPVCRAVWR